MVKRAVLNCVLIAVLIFSAETASCNTFGKSRGNGSVKLLECITDDNGNLKKKFEYDRQNRIVKIYHYYSNEDDKEALYLTTAITYSADDLVTVEEINNIEDRKANDFVRNGNIITTETEAFTLTVNSDGYIVSKEGDGWYYECQYLNGNLIKDGNLIDENIYSVRKYDSKKSPFSNSNTPKWLLQYLFTFSYADKNNILRIDHNSEVGSTKYKYRYDRDGFPTKETAETFSALCDAECTTVVRFIYLTKSK
jgi:predicted small secreted protein